MPTKLQDHRLRDALRLLETYAKDQRSVSEVVVCVRPDGRAMVELLSVDGITMEQGRRRLYRDGDSNNANSGEWYYEERSF